MISTCPHGHGSWRSLSQELYCIGSAPKAFKRLHFWNILFKVDYKGNIILSYTISIRKVWLSSKIIKRYDVSWHAENQSYIYIYMIISLYVFTIQSNFSHVHRITQIMLPLSTLDNFFLIVTLWKPLVLIRQRFWTEKNKYRKEDWQPQTMQLGKKKKTERTFCMPLCWVVQ